MRRIHYWLGVTLVAGSFSSALQAAEAAAPAAPTVEQRLERIERMVNSQSLLDMLDRIDSLQQEVEQLRGQVEEQQHTIEGLKSRQRELYLDIDRRISQIEREGGGTGSVASEPSTATGQDTAASATLPLTGAAAPATDANAAQPQQTDADKAEQERVAYQKAFDMLRELRYAQATAAFRDFLKQYPNGRYAHIAQYWLGEASYAQRDFRQAITDYNALLVNYPKSPKLAEAMLKIGYSHYELKEPKQAKEVLEQLLQQYPKSTEAGQARNLLKRINNNGG